MSRHAGLPGFRDFYPSDFAVRAHITGTWRDVARRHGFEEYDGPPLEALDLYIEKSGEEIVGQLYSFTDRGGRSVALRPEMTPTLARMVGARAGALRKPIRWFAVPQLFRYERAQRGRLREHFQWNVDVLGEPDIGADVEVLAIALDGLRALGLDEGDIVARFSDRHLLETLFLAAGVPADRLPTVYGIADKLTREPVERVRERLRDADLSDGVADGVLHVFAVGGGLDGMRREFGGVAGVAEALERLDRYHGELADLGLGEYVAFDPAIVRGLAYYTGIVFEIFDRRGELRAICGGGRYDRLLRAVAGADLAACGFGMGDVVLGELLAARGLLPGYAPAADDYIVAVTETERPLLRRLASRLRADGRTVVHALRPQSVARQFREADALGARRVIVLGPDELAAGVAVARDMGSGDERRVPLADLLGDETV
jgi:histidyl-tRNA synthetase